MECAKNTICTLSLPKSDLHGTVALVHCCSERHVHSLLVKAWTESSLEATTKWKRWHFPIVRRLVLFYFLHLFVIYDDFRPGALAQRELLQRVLEPEGREEHHGVAAVDADELLVIDQSILNIQSNRRVFKTWTCVVSCLVGNH